MGSCFAQHIGRALAARGFRWVEGEPAPPFMSPQARARFNYGVFSFRTGNIYTPALLKQWIDWAFGNSSPPADVWSERGRYYDPFRPAIEPNGFASADEMLASRESALNGIRNAILASDYFVFTLGLTEGWINTSGHVYPMCPGTTAGAFDPARHHFINYDYRQTRMLTHEAFAIISHYKPGIRYILTVSPVPLTATATGGHVVVATTYSKSTLRAVAGDMYRARTDLDYFPSFEIISAHPFRGSFYDPNMRTVSSLGVEFVMNSFFRALRPYETQAIAPNPSNDVICEEELLDAFT